MKLGKPGFIIVAVSPKELDSSLDHPNSQQVICRGSRAGGSGEVLKSGSDQLGQPGSQFSDLDLPFQFPRDPVFPGFFREQAFEAGVDAVG